MSGNNPYRDELYLQGIDGNRLTVVIPGDAGAQATPALPVEDAPAAVIPARPSAYIAIKARMQKRTKFTDPQLDAGVQLGLEMALEEAYTAEHGK